MLGGNNGNPVVPVFLDENRFQYQTTASNQLQLFGKCNLVSHSIIILPFVCLIIFLYICLLSTSPHSFYSFESCFACKRKMNYEN